MYVMHFIDISLTITALQTTSLVLQWTLPVIDASQLSSQTISITYEGPCQPIEVAEPRKVIVLGPEIRMIILEDLEENSDYFVMISAEYPSETLSDSTTFTTLPTGMANS